MGGLGLINPSDSADAEYSASIRVSAPLVSKIEAQSHETPEEAEVQRLVYAIRKEKDDGLKEELEEVKAMLPDKTQRAVDLACEKGASNWLTVIPLKDMDSDLNKREFRDAVRLRYDWPIPDNPSVCVCGSMFTVDHAMICHRGGLVIQCHNEIRNLQAELLDMVCYDVQVEPALQPITVVLVLRTQFTLVFYVFASYCFITVLIITVSYVIIILNVKSSPQSYIFGSKLLAEKKLSITLFVMTVASFLTILPWAVWVAMLRHIWCELSPAIAYRFYLTFSALYLCNSIVNPIIYALRTQEFRKAARKLCC